MKQDYWSRYMELCLGYRSAFVLLSSIVYLCMVAGFDRPGGGTWLVILGILLSCAQASYLFVLRSYIRKIEKQQEEIHSQWERHIVSEEQNRIANEIHDTVIQRLFGMACSLQVLEKGLDGMDPELQHRKLCDLKKSAEQTMQELRETIYGRKFDDVDQSFATRLKQSMEEIGRLGGADIAVQLDQKAEMLSAAQKIAIYRIACEAANNGIRHGQANQLAVNLSVGENRIMLDITDNGCGFQKIQSEPLGGHGLKNMYHMAALLRGELNVVSGKEAGTRIQLSLPR